MDTLKTGFVVVLLLAVLYGVYVVLNTDQTPPNAEIAWHEQEAAKDLQIEIGPATGDPSSASTTDPVTSTSSSVSSSAPIDPTLPTSSASDLGIPSVIKAELTPSEPPASLPSADLKPVPADDLALKPSPDPPPTPTVTAPGLLPAKPDEGKTEEPSSNDLATAPEKPSVLPTLPSLRDAAEPAQPESAPTAASLEQPATIDRFANNDKPSATTDGTFPVAAETNEDAAAATATADASATATGTPGLKAASTEQLLAAALREAHNNIADEKWFEALFVLSKFYGKPDLTSQQEQELVDLLDPLAAKVIYSQEHLVAEAYEVRRGETLAQIAEQCQVPPELLANINGLDNPELLVPGTKLKVVRGPFSADICLSKQELTLYSGELYAGRFPVAVGETPRPAPGEYRVMEKLPGKDYFGASGQQLSADDPENPYGHVWINLGKGLAIHGSSDRGDSSKEGCISLSPLDAYDISCILSNGSSVRIRE